MLINVGVVIFSTFTADTHFSTHAVLYLQNLVSSSIIWGHKLAGANTKLSLVKFDNGSVQTKAHSRVAPRLPEPHLSEPSTIRTNDIHSIYGLLHPLNTHITSLIQIFSCPNGSN